MSTSFCSKCQTELPREQFETTKHGTAYSWCRPCKRAATRASKAAQKIRDDLRCRCGALITAGHTRCRSCFLKDRRGAFQRKQVAAAGLRVVAQTKRCSCCKEELEFSQFSNDKKRLDGKSSNCRSCAAFSNYRVNARRRATQYGQPERYAWGLTRARFFALFSAPCTFCGKTPSRGVDRLNTHSGYSEENSVPCCSLCNTMKGDLDVDDWVGQMTAVLRHLHSTT